jgi:hypothetical protein
MLIQLEILISFLETQILGKQIDKYSASEEFVGMHNLLKIIFVFCNDKVVYEQRID